MKIIEKNKITQEEIKMKVQEILKMAEKRNVELINKYSNINNYLAAKKAQKENNK